MAAAVLTLALAFICGGGLWLGVGSRLALSDDPERNEVLNLLVLVGGSLPPAFLIVFFFLEAL